MVYPEESCSKLSSISFQYPLATSCGGVVACMRVSVNQQKYQLLAVDRYAQLRYPPGVPESHVSRCSRRLEVGEWQLARKQLPEAEREGEDVRLDGVLGALREHLRGHPAQVAGLLGHVLLPEVGQEPGLPEVGDDRPSLLVEENVVRVEISVDDRLGQGVEVVHTAGHVQGNVQLETS